MRLVLKNGSFAGVAFVDVRDWSKIKPALALHQSSLRCAEGAARRINVREAVSKEQLAKLLHVTERASRGKARWQER